jgi:hypothetical protein
VTHGDKIGDSRAGATKTADMLYRSQGQTEKFSAGKCSAWNEENTTLFSGHYLLNRSTLDIGVLGYVGIL